MYEAFALSYIEENVSFPSPCPFFSNKHCLPQEIIMSSQRICASRDHQHLTEIKKPSNALIKHGGTETVFFFFRLMAQTKSFFTRSFYFSIIHSERGATNRFGLQMAKASRPSGEGVKGR